MNVVDTLNLAKKMIKLDERHNQEILDFYYSVLITEAKIMDAKKLKVEEATDVVMVMSYMHDRCVGKKSIFASRIIRDGYEKLKKICDDRIICESFIFSTSMLENEEVIKEREYFTSDEGIQEFYKALKEKKDSEDGSDET